VPEQTYAPKKRLAKSYAIGLMIAGGGLLVTSWFIPIEPQSTLQPVKTGISAIGFIVLFLGAYFRP